MEISQGQNGAFHALVLCFIFLIGASNSLPVEAITNIDAKGTIWGRSKPLNRPTLDQGDLPTGSGTGQFASQLPLDHGAESAGNLPSPLHGVESAGNLPLLNRLVASAGNLPPLNHGIESAGNLPPLNQGIESAGNLPPLNHGIESAGSLPPLNRGTENAGNVPPMNYAFHGMENAPPSLNLAESARNTPLLRPGNGQFRSFQETPQMTQRNNPSLADSLAALINDVEGGRKFPSDVGSGGSDWGAEQPFLSNNANIRAAETQLGTGITKNVLPVPTQGKKVEQNAVQTADRQHMTRFYIAATERNPDGEDTPLFPLESGHPRIPLAETAESKLPTKSGLPTQFFEDNVRELGIPTTSPKKADGSVSFEQDWTAHSSEERLQPKVSQPSWETLLSRRNSKNVRHFPSFGSTLSGKGEAISRSELLPEDKPSVNSWNNFHLSDQSAGGNAGKFDLYLRGRKGFARMPVIDEQLNKGDATICKLFFLLFHVTNSGFGETITDQEQ